MNVPKVDIKQLLEAGVHLGHKTLRWNPKMKKYIFGEKNSIHIIDLTQTVEFLKNALFAIHKVIASSGKILIVSKIFECNEIKEAYEIVNLTSKKETYSFIYMYMCMYIFYFFAATL